MTYRFVDEIPEGLRPPAGLISGDDSRSFPRGVFLVMYEAEQAPVTYEIRYNFHCSPFKSVIVSGELMAVGHEDFFYLYDRSTRKNLLRIPLSGYFGELHLEQKRFYVADANGIYCINLSGELVWKNEQLGIDGVSIHHFTTDSVNGAGEWDPPGGWRNFSIRKDTGVIIE